MVSFYGLAVSFYGLVVSLLRLGGKLLRLGGKLLRLGAKRRRNDRGTDGVQRTLETLTQPEPKKRGAADGHEPGGEKEMKVGGASVNTPVEKPARKKRDSADARCNPTYEPPTIYEQALKWGEEWHARSRSR